MKLSVIDYIPAAVALAALVLGIAGKPKWDASRRGLARLTTTGRLALAIGVLAFVASLVLTHRAHSQSREQARQHAELRSIAHAEARKAVAQITNPFFVLFGDAGVDAATTLAPPHLDDPQRRAVIGAIETCSIGTAYEGSPGWAYASPWKSILKLNSQLGLEEITDVLRIYGPFLEPEVIKGLSELRRSQYANLDIIGGLDCADARPVTPIEPFRGAGKVSGDAYLLFWEVVKRLDTLLERDPQRLRVLM